MSRRTFRECAYLEDVEYVFNHVLAIPVQMSSENIVLRINCQPYRTTTHLFEPSTLQLFLKSIPYRKHYRLFEYGKDHVLFFHVQPRKEDNEEWFQSYRLRPQEWPTNGSKTLMRHIDTVVQKLHTRSLSIGLANCGNSCFINAALQVLSCAVKWVRTNALGDMSTHNKTAQLTIRLLQECAKARAERRVICVDSIIPNTQTTFGRMISVLRRVHLTSNRLEQGDATEIVQKILDSVGDTSKVVQYVPRSELYDTGESIEQLEWRYENKSYLVRRGDALYEDLTSIWDMLPVPRSLASLCVFPVLSRSPEVLFVSGLHPHKVNQLTLPRAAHNFVFSLEDVCSLIGLSRGSDIPSDVPGVHIRAKWVKSVNDPETTLVLKMIPETQSINDMIHAYTRPEAVAVTPNDTTLNNHVMWKRMSIQPTSYLFIIVSRSYYDVVRHRSTKLTQDIHVDFNIYLQGHKYHLLSTAHHLGSSGHGGHYISIVRTDDSKWLLLDDARGKYISTENIRQYHSGVYALLYKKSTPSS